MSRQDFVRLAAGADITGEKTLYCGTQQQWRSTWLMIPFDKILVLRPVNVNRAVAKRFANKKPEPCNGKQYRDVDTLNRRTGIGPCQQQQCCRKQRSDDRRVGKKCVKK